MSKSDSLADPVKLRFLIFIGCPHDGHRQGPPVFIIVWLPPRVPPVTPEAHLSVMAVIVRIDAPVFPFVGEGLQLQFHFRGYIQVRLRCNPRVCSTPLRAFVRELSASGYPLHLPPATWANCRTPTVGL